MAEFDPSAIFNVVDLIGVVANGLLGGALARAMKFDFVGFVVLGIASGLGGGMVRDILLDNGPPVALTNPLYLPCAILAAAAAYLLVLGGKWTGRALVVADVLALGCWSATGTGKAFALGLAPVPCLMLGVVTAVGGGVIRDVLAGRTPVIFGASTLYASIALVGSSVMLAGNMFGHPQIGMVLAIAACAVLGLLSRRRGWKLPAAADWDLRLSPLGVGKRFAPRRRGSE